MPFSFDTGRGNCERRVSKRTVKQKVSKMMLREYKAMRAGTAAHLMGGWRPRGFVSFGPIACPNTPSHFDTLLNGADYIINTRVSAQQQISRKQS
jgi:hypothetical protein